MAKRCYYDVLGVSRERSRAARSSLRFAASPRNVIPTAATAIPRREALQGTQRGLRGVEGPAEAARPMTASAMPPSRTAWAAGGAHGFGADFSASMSAMFDDLFGEFMGGSAGRASARRASGAPISATTWRSRSPKPMRARRRRSACRPRVTCDACSGSGAKAGTSPDLLPRHAAASARCARAKASSPSSAPVPTCQGRGETIETPCPSCSGAGRVTRERTLSVTIPVGRRGRHAHQARRRRRGGLARRAAWRPLHLPLDQAA